MSVLIYPYNMGSISAKRLAMSIGAKRVRQDGRYRAMWNDLVVNWGNSTNPHWFGRILNMPEKVKNATNKLKTFQILKEHSIRTPEFSTNKEVAEQWVSEGNTVYCRSKLSGHSGSGIVLATGVSEIPTVPLYTKRIKAKTEFRVHVFGNALLDFQQKKRRDGANANHLIRNHSNGYVFAREGVILPDDVREQAINAVTALGLDFGAVDIGYVEREQKAYVYEVNTAPGLENTTLSLYTNAIKERAQHV